MKKKILASIILVIGFIVIVIGYKVYAYYNYSGELVGILNTNTYHRDNCKFVKKMSGDKLVLFSSKLEAAEKGYRACKTCDPPDNEKELVAAAKEKEQKNAQANESLFDISKIEILGSGVEKHEIFWLITGTVKNNDSEKHIFYVQAIFYDKNKKPIATEKKRMVVSPNSISEFEIMQDDNLKNIESYDLQVVN